MTLARVGGGPEGGSLVRRGSPMMRRVPLGRVLVLPRDAIPVPRAVVRVVLVVHVVLPRRALPVPRAVVGVVLAVPVVPLLRVVRMPRVVVRVLPGRTVLRRCAVAVPLVEV